LPPRPYIRGCDFEPVRLVGEHPDTRLQFIFRADRYGDCRYGWEADLWRDDEPGGQDGGGEPGLPDPEALAGEILMSLMEDLEASGYGPPDECDPDDEGITWVRDPYGDRASWDRTFVDDVEWALRQYVPKARPHSREVVRQLLATGVDSSSALVDIVTSDRTDELAAAALWLLAELGDTTAVTPLLGGLPGLNERGRLHTVAKLRMLVRRENESALQAAFLAESAQPVRAALMDALLVGTTTTRDLALAVLSDDREPAGVRAAAARTLGCTSVGEPEVVAELCSVLQDTDADVVAGAARGLALCVPLSATPLLEGLVDDGRVTGSGKTVGGVIAGEIEALARRCQG